MRTSLILVTVNPQPAVVSSHPLDSFDRDERRAAMRRCAEAMPRPVAPDAGAPVNMHLHTFFSFNIAGSSPSHVAVQARRWGLYAAATTDFDVLDAADEFLEAAAVLGLRAAAHIETRAYAPEFATVETNSPGEPGICYVMGAAFPHTPRPDLPTFAMARELRERAASRNAAVVERVNALLPDIAICYEDDVAGLTPGRSPTERHIVRAYLARAARVMPDARARAAFWGGVLRQPAAELAVLPHGALQDRVRRRLIKHGGVAYQQPGPGSFPEIGAFFDWVRDSDAVPMAAWRDGTSAGESDPAAWLDALQARGAASVNVVPGLVTDARNLELLMAEVMRRDLPVGVGTEMNADGLPDYDDLDSALLAPHRTAFVTGAEVFVGHTVLARYAAFPYCGAAAEARYPDRARRNEFFAAVGRLPPLDTAAAAELAAMGPAAALGHLHQAAHRAERLRG